MPKCVELSNNNLIKLRRGVRSSGILPSAELYFVTDVSGKYIHLNFKIQAIQENYSWTS